MKYLGNLNSRSDIKLIVGIFILKWIVKVKQHSPSLLVVFNEQKQNNLRKASWNISVDWHKSWYKLLVKSFTQRKNRY